MVLTSEADCLPLQLKCKHKPMWPGATLYTKLYGHLSLPPDELIQANNLC